MTRRVLPFVVVLLVGLGLTVRALALPSVPTLPINTSKLNLPGSVKDDLRLPDVLQPRLAFAEGLVLPTTHADLTTAGAPAAAGPLDSAMKKASAALESVRNAERCFTQGLDAAGCDARKMVADTACVLGGAAPNPNNPFFLLARASPTTGRAIAKVYDLLFHPESPFCVNASDVVAQASLKCCKYTPEQEACHSAFNTPAPVNCEGNPGFLSSAKSFGPCLPVNGGPGCLCDYLAECDLGGAATPMPGIGSAFYVSAWFSDLTEAYQGLVDTPGAVGNREGRPTLDDLGRLVTFKGCKGRLDVLDSADPFRLVDPAQPLEYQRVTAVQQQLAHAAATRVMLAVPNALARLDHARGQRWTSQEQDSFLRAAGVLDADAVLRESLSETGLFLLKQSMPGDYRLLAAPAPGEPAIDRPAGADFEDGCELGLAPDVQNLKVLPGKTAGSVTASFVVNDPEAGASGLGYLAVDWGDGRIETHMVYRAGQAGSVSHTYTEAGRYLVSVSATNIAGQSDREHASVELNNGSCKRVLASVVAVVLEGKTQRLGVVSGDLSVRVNGLDERGRRIGLGSVFQADLRGFDELGAVTLTNPALGPVLSLELQIRRFADLIGGRLVLRAVRLVEREANSTSERVFSAANLTPTGGEFSRSSDGSLELRADQDYRLPLPVGTDGIHVCGQGSNP